MFQKYLEKFQYRLSYDVQEKSFIRLILEVLRRRISSVLADIHQSLLELDTNKPIIMWRI